MEYETTAHLPTQPTNSVDTLQRRHRGQPLRKLNWLPKDVYQRHKKRYVQEHFSKEKEEFFQNLPEDLQQKTPEYIDNAFRVFLYAKFAGIATILNAIDTIRSSEEGMIPITISPDSNSNTRNIGEAYPNMHYDDQHIDFSYLLQIPYDQLNRFIFSSINIYINTNWIFLAIEGIQKELAQAKQYGVPREALLREEARLQRELEKKTEGIMVHEAAHALSYLSANNNVVKKRRIISLLTTRNLHPIPPERELTPEEEDAYLKNFQEKQAHLWQRAFLRFYYPRSEAAREEKERFSRSTLR